MGNAVAVLMAAYNAERTIRAAVDSVLANTIPCDLIIVDDASRIPAADALGTLNGPIEIIRLTKNLGPAEARNVGLQHILAQNYRYVAILDADDIAYPERFERQMAYLDAHPRVAAVGTGQRFIDHDTGELLFRDRPACDPDDVRNAMFFNCALGHTSMMMRTAALAQVGFYLRNYPVAEDYELMWRLSTRYDLANLPECLTDYRISRAGLSLKRRRRQLFDRLCIQLKYLAPLNWRAWAGIANTLALFVVPRPLITALKRRRYATRSRLGPAQEQGL